MIPNLVIAVLTAGFDAQRRAACERLLAELQPQCAAHGVRVAVYLDHAARGSLEPAIALIEAALDHEPTHVTFLPDDAILVPNFVEVLLDVIAAEPNEIICCQSNDARAAKLPGHVRWYTTMDGFTGFGGTMPAAMWREYLQWRTRALAIGAVVAFDEGVNLFAMHTGRLIHKPLPSLVDHDTSLPSLDGNDSGENASTPRRPVVWDATADLRDVRWRSQPPIFLGRTYRGNHWKLAYEVRPEQWDLEAMYLVERRGAHVSAKPHVFIATAGYQPLEEPMRRSRQAVSEDLLSHGYEVTHFESPGDSLVTRGRHALQHEFMRSTATHFLQWDADVEVVDDPSCVRRMIETGYDVIGCAYPFRDGSGMVVANPLLDESGGQIFESDQYDCMRVAAVGTGFMLLTRAAITRTAQANPHLLYEADMPCYDGAAMFALFDVALVPFLGRRNRFRYLSEDWQFCRLWRELGEHVYCYLPPTLRHWGKTGHTSHILDAWNLRGEYEQRDEAAQ